MPTFEVSQAFNVKFNIMCLFYGLMPRNPFYTSNGAIRVYCQCPVKLTSSLIVNSSAQIETGYGATVSHLWINIKPHFYDQYSACCSVCIFCWFIRYRKDVHTFATRPPQTILRSTSRFHQIVCTFTTRFHTFVDKFNTRFNMLG